MPTKLNEIKIPAGPACASAFPEPTSKPGPMIPAIAILSAEVVPASAPGAHTDHLQMSRLQPPLQRRNLAILRLDRVQRFIVIVVCVGRSLRRVLRKIRLGAGVQRFMLVCNHVCGVVGGNLGCPWNRTQGARENLSGRRRRRGSHGTKCDLNLRSLREGHARFSVRRTR